MGEETATIIWQAMQAIWEGIWQGIWQVIPEIAVVFAAIAAYGACLSAVATRRAVQGQLFANLLRDYSSKDMHEALKKLQEVKRKKEKDVDYWNTMIKHWNDNRKDMTNIEAAYPDVNEARRRVSHYFTTALELHQNKNCIGDCFLKVICRGNVELLYGIVEHLEYALNERYARDQFTKILDFCERDIVAHLEAIRPKQK